MTSQEELKRLNHAWSRMGYWNDRELDAENLVSALVYRAAHEYWRRRYNAINRRSEGAGE
jgi:hypothetical protein